MASAFPESYNPFEAPATSSGATLAGPAGTDVELIRRRYLSHEASIRAIGMLYYLGAFFGVLGALVMLGMAVYMFASPPVMPPDAPPINPAIFLAGGGLLYLVLGALNGGLGYGLRRLQTWARWVMVVFMVLTLLYVVVVSGGMFVMSPNAATAAGLLIGSAIGGAIPAYILYLMISAKGSVVFSPGYREVVAQTPHIKYKTSLLIKILLGFLIFIIVLAIVGAIVGGVNR